MAARTAILLGVVGCLSAASVACRSGGARSDAAPPLPPSEPGPSSEPTDPDAAWGPLRWEMTVDEATAALARFAPAVERRLDWKTGDNNLRIDFKWGTWEGTVGFDGCRRMKEIWFRSPSFASCGVASRATEDVWTQRFGERSDDRTVIEYRWRGPRTVLVETRWNRAGRWSVGEEWYSARGAPAAATPRPIDAVDGWRGVPWGAPFERIRETLGDTAYTIVDVPGPWANGPTSPFPGRCAWPTKREMRFEEGNRSVTIELGPEGCLLGVRVDRTEPAPVSEEDRWGEPDDARVESVQVWKDGRTEAELVVVHRGPGREGPGWECTQSELYRPIARPAPTRSDGRPCSTEPPVALLRYLLQRDAAAPDAGAEPGAHDGDDQSPPADDDGGLR
ncbi:MAG: hypothetical protein JXB32_11695 [Deltaproteobacteria bacterium]|nr:hypothetical protein [Deltaproteobacteria bacterium]